MQNNQSFAHADWWGTLDAASLYSKYKPSSSGERRLESDNGKWLIPVTQNVGVNPLLLRPGSICGWDSWLQLSKGDYQ